MVPSQPLTLRQRAAVVVASLACLAATNACAAIWGYVDEQGQTHVATEKLDERYQLLYKGPSTADRTEVPATEADLEALKQRPHIQRLLNDPRVASYDKLIAQNAKAQGVDPALVKAIVAVESAFIADAVSNKGALGLMQVIPQTAMRYGVAADAKRSVEQKLLDPRINVGIGTRYLRDLLAMFGGDVSLALAAYNAGEQAVEHYDRRIPPYAETQEFVKLVQQFYAIYLPPSAPIAKPPARIMVPPRAR